MLMIKKCHYELDVHHLCLASGHFLTVFVMGVSNTRDNFFFLD